VYDFSKDSGLGTDARDEEPMVADVWLLEDDEKQADLEGTLMVKTARGW
jgi:hypothetical protein